MTSAIICGFSLRNSPETQKIGKHLRKMRKRRGKMNGRFATLILLGIIALAMPAYANVWSIPEFTFTVQGFEIPGVPGSEAMTGSSARAYVTPSFFPNGAGNQEFTHEPWHCIASTFAWCNDPYGDTSKMWSTQTQTTYTEREGYDRAFGGIVMVGCFELRPTITLSWTQDSLGSDLGWSLGIYDLQHRRTILTKQWFSGTISSGTIDVPTYARGYYICVRAYDPSTLPPDDPFYRAAVPEPGSILALGSGLVGLAGFGLRRRR
jgi:hypothetical protein